ncbi:MAG: VOC family protein [Candidatus Binatia bacterium]
MLRLRQVALVARSLAPVVEEIRDVLGLEVAFRDPSVASFGLENALFPIGDQFLEVVSPIRQGTAAGRYLDRRGGDGGYMVILQCDDPAERERRAVALGIRKAFEQDTGGYRVLQLHPGDTGGCFLSVDFQEGGEDREGPWHPAGPTWPAAVRSGVVCGITAVEIQSPEPAKLAARWQEILDLPLETDSTLRLDDAAIRFGEDRDGRGEGLGALELVTVDRSRLLAAAERRGHRVSVNRVEICGTGFHLAADRSAR